MKTKIKYYKNKLKMKRTSTSLHQLDPLKKKFISPAFTHSKSAYMFGRVNKDGIITEVEPYQSRPLNEYIDIENLSQQLNQGLSPNEVDAGNVFNL